MKTSVATGGTITAAGLFTAGPKTGQFTVHAETDGIEAIAEVRVAKAAEVSVPEEKKNGVRTIAWSGSVAPQKWMNFYTKVLSRFAASPDLKLTVSFQVTAESEQAKTKADEARTGLRELGLGGDVEVR